MINDHVDHLKWYWNELDILEYEKDKEEYWNNREIALKNLAENDKEEIGDLNRRINCLKIEERKLRGDEKSRREEIQKRKKKK